MDVEGIPGNKSTNEELISYLRDLGQRIGRTPSIPILKKDKKYNSLLFTRRFGNWNIALVTAGFTPSVIVETKQVN
ncbi:MAG: hypothetical protein ABIT08_17410, partial [Bacteroidia bacterium]